MLDWTVKSGTPALATNPLRLLPKRYATYTDEDRIAVTAQDQQPKDDVHRDRRPSPDERERSGACSMAASRPNVSAASNCHTGLRWCFSLTSRSNQPCACAKCTRSRQTSSTCPGRTASLEKTKNGSKRAVPLMSVAIAAYQCYVDAVNDGDPDMFGFSFDAGYLFPWVPEQLREMRLPCDAAVDKKLLAKITSRLSGQFGRISMRPAAPT